MDLTKQLFATFVISVIDGIDEILYEYKILQRNHYLFTNALLVHLCVSLEACKLQNIMPIFFLQVT